MRAAWEQKRDEILNFEASEKPSPEGDSGNIVG